MTITRAAAVVAAGVITHTGGIGRIRSWVLYTAIAEAGGQPSPNGDPPPYVGVSLSGRELAEPQLRERVRRMLSTLGLDPRRLTSVEIGETDAEADPGRILRMVGRLRDLGLRISVEDLGTGWSTLLHAPASPVGQLEIDGSVLAGVVGRPEEASLARLVVEMSHELRLAALEAGIETFDQRDQLEWVGCDHGRGYRWTPALSAVEVRAWLAAVREDPPEVAPWPRILSSGP